MENLNDEKKKENFSRCKFYSYSILKLSPSKDVWSTFRRPWSLIPPRPWTVCWLNEHTARTAPRGYEFLSFDLVLDVYRPANNFVSSISPSRIERFKVSLRSIIEQKQIRSLWIDLKNFLTNSSDIEFPVPTKPVWPTRANYTRIEVK